MNHFFRFLLRVPCKVGIQQQYMPANLSQYINPNADMKAKLAINAHISKNLALILGYLQDCDVSDLARAADCRFGQNCRFAHGEEELRHVHAKPRLADNPRYKTRPCEKFVKKGICPYGPRCLFIHPDLSSNMSPGLLLPLDDQGRASPGQNMPFSANVLAPVSMLNSLCGLRRNLRSRCRKSYSYFVYLVFG
uniref:C3H1-type domain-containing protein n=1 Tax=Ditylenchus dipsaci TaxID=166011 RepID=A0A915D8J7_9BILA